MVEIERDEPPEPSPIDGLFTATQRRVLAILFGEPTRAFHVRELLALTGAGHGAVQRELQRLRQAGLIFARRDKNRSLLQADPESPIHAELTAMVRKTVGLAEPLRLAFGAAERYVHLCFVFEPERDPWCPDVRDLGLLLVPGAATIPMEAFDYGRELAESQLGRSIWMVTADAQRLRTDYFIARVLERPRIWVFGSEDMLDLVLAR